MKSSRSTHLWLRPLAAVGVATAMAFAMTACKSNAPAPITNIASDPNAADGNLAPVTGSGGQPTQVLGQSASYQPQQQSESYNGQQPPAPIEQGAPQQGYADTSGGQYPDQSNDAYNNQDVSEYAQQAPPPLPDYDQPPAPDPNYIWTPGYWAYGDQGYYWAPGVWCPPPYYGALWTPPYWGFYGGRYGFHHGYWGLHIGFYGGVDYGFGYVGTGYFGGYWHGNDFYYNRAVTNVNFRTNVYERPVVFNGHTYGRGIENRVSYNGGQGGLRVAPRPAEMAAMHENHVGPIAAQTQVRTEASQNRAQFYNTNHGRPAQTAFARPAGSAGGPPHIAEAPAAVRQDQQRSVAVEHNTQAQQQRTAAPENRPGVAPQQQRGAEPNRAAEPQRGVEPQQQRGAEPNRAAPQQQQRAVEQQRAAPQQQQRTAEPQRAAPQQQQRAVEPQRAAPQQQQRPAEQQRVAPQQQQRAAEPQRAAPEARPAPVERAAPAARPAPEARPAPAPRAAAPAPRPAPAPRAAPAPRPAPAAHEEPHR